MAKMNVEIFSILFFFIIFFSCFRFVNFYSVKLFIVSNIQNTKYLVYEVTKVKKLPNLDGDRII